MKKKRRKKKFQDTVESVPEESDLQKQKRPEQAELKKRKRKTKLECEEEFKKTKKEKEARKYSVKDGCRRSTKWQSILPLEK